MYRQGSEDEHSTFNAVKLPMLSKANTRGTVAARLHVDVETEARGLHCRVARSPIGCRGCSSVPRRYPVSTS